MKLITKPSFIIPLLISCYILFFILSWILVFRDPRAIIGIGNLYPGLKDFLFSTQAQLAHYGLNSIPTILFALTALTAFIGYFLALRLKISLKKAVLVALIFQFITFLSFPILSTDIFSYIFSERVSTVHNENIWKVKPAAFPDDQFGVLADWKDTTNVYGALNYLLYAGPSVLGQNDLLSLVILFKFIPVVFAFGIMFVVYKLLQLYKVKDIAKYFILLFWNPLFILEIFGSGHNDSMMLFFALVSFYLFKRKLWLVAGIALALSVQIKLITVVLFFFSLVLLLREKAIRSAILYAAGFIIINVLAFMYMQVPVLEFLTRVAYNGGVYWQSLQNIIQTFLPGQSSYLMYAFLLWGLVYTVIFWKKKLSPAHAYGVVLLVYIVFISAAYWNWYVLWPFLFLPFVQKRNIQAAILLLTITSLLAYPLLWVIHRINSPSLFWPILQYLFIFGPPVLLYIYSRLQPATFEKLLRKFNLHDLIAEKA